MVRGNPKGKKGEREVARLLERWWSSYEPGAKFVRTPQSGGWHGPDMRVEFKASGDIMTTATRFPFSVEVKRGQAWSWRELFAGRKSPVWAWWRQALGQGKESGLEPMLWFRKNRQPWHVLIRKDYADRLKGPSPAMIMWSNETLFIRHGFTIADGYPICFSADVVLANPPGFYDLKKHEPTYKRRRIA
jgi:hypothetical protein